MIYGQLAETALWDMTTTTVTGTGRLSSTRPSGLQKPTKAPNTQPMTSPVDKFPPYSDEPYDTSVHPGEPQSSSTIKYAPKDLWEPRKTSIFSREHGNGPVRSSRHRSRKSISEAISAIRTRNASMSANAQELAQALRAPVSYQLIVRWFTTRFHIGFGSLIPVSSFALSGT